MSQSILNAIERARFKRIRKWDQWWKSRMSDPVKKKEIELDRTQFEERHEKGIPLELIPLKCPESEWTSACGLAGEANVRQAGLAGKASAT